MSLAVLLAAADEPWESTVAQDVQQVPGLHLARRCVDVADVVATAASGRADVALLSMRLPGLDVDVVRRLRESGAVPVVVAPTRDQVDAARATALGVAAVVGVDDVVDLPRVVEDARAGADEPPAPGAEPGHGRVVTVWGPTGAPGRSTVAVGLASEAAHLGIPTLLVDADVHGGAVAPMLAMLDEVSGLLAAARAANAGGLDAAGLASHSREVVPGLTVLTGLPRADRWPALRPAAFDAVLEVARTTAALVVVDVGFDLDGGDDELGSAAPRRTATALAALDRADTVVAVGSADPLGLARLTRGLHDLREVVPARAPLVVVNRVRDSLGWDTDEVSRSIERFTGVAPSAFLRDDRAAVDRAWVHGQALVECAPDAPLRRDLAELTRQVVVRDGPLPGRTRSRRRRRPLA
ncbi:AAA family ATPase [Solicola sp. PLA-1-18]|uniref:AAA family ATPase n=1 Tax=Solicola sp. PLA-1-18 TaxID=3380532 RepID=UPI003B7A46C6